MSAEGNKAIVRQFVEALNRRDLAAAAELLAPDVVIHTPGADVEGRKGWREFVAGFLAAFPDLHLTIEDTIAEGDKAVMRWTERGTHEGQFADTAPTGKVVTLSGMDIYRLAGGKIAEAWIWSDTLGLLQQIGAIPA